MPVYVNHAKFIVIYCKKYVYKNNKEVNKKITLF